MDTTADLSATLLKRAARAILKDELKAARQKLQREREGHAKVLAECQKMLAERITDHDRLAQNVVKLRVRIADIETRGNRALQWAEQHQSGNYAIRACIEWSFKGPDHHVRGAGCMNVNPFDRWNISPALR